MSYPALRLGAAGLALTASLTVAGCTPGSANLTYPLTGPALLTQTFSSHHPGVDLAATAGTAVLAATSGQISVVEGIQESGGYGNYVCIDNTPVIRTCYAHLSAVLVAPGQDVETGQRIGRVGSTGHSTGPHLHFELRLGADHLPADPLARLDLP